MSRSVLGRAAVLAAVVAFVWQPSAAPAADAGANGLESGTVTATCNGDRWEHPSVHVQGPLRIEGDSPKCTLVLNGARIEGDLTIVAHVARVELNDAEVSGSLWIGDYAGRENAVAWPADDKNNNRWPDDDTEGLWTSWPRETDGPATEVQADRLQARNLFMRYRSFAGVRARHADVKDTIYFDFSSFADSVDLGFARAQILEMVGVSVAKELHIQFARIGDVDLTDVSARLLDAMNAYVDGKLGASGLHSADGPLKLFIPDAHIGTLSLIAAFGQFSELDMARDVVGTLELDYGLMNGVPVKLPPSLDKPLHYDAVFTNGASFQFVRPAMGAETARGDRVAEFAKGAAGNDERIYRKLAEAYGRSGQEEAANDAWRRNGALSWVAHASLFWSISVSCVALLAGTVLGFVRLRKEAKGTAHGPKTNGLYLMLRRLLDMTAVTTLNC